MLKIDRFYQNNYEIVVLTLLNKLVLFSDLRWDRSLFSQLLWNISEF